jgi:hypothetical protein
MAGQPTDVISATLDAPAREISRCAAARRCGTSSKKLESSAATPILR